MKKKLLEFCRTIGIDCVGIADAGPYDELKTILVDKIQKGLCINIKEEELEYKINPKLSIEDAQSIIVCAFPYYIGEHKSCNLPKYAYSIDYHILVRNMLQRVGEYLEDIIKDFKYSAHVDTGPLSDRYLAYKSGIGFFGVNSHIITEKYGSYVTIGYIITNYEFEPDSPMYKTCCKCMKCVNSCPGSAIKGDFSIEEISCRSYITQKKEDLTEKDIEILKKGDLVFGCDICQDVCPHNRNVKSSTIDEFYQNIKCNLDYEEIKDISNKAFMRNYKDRAFAWRGRKVLMRNFEILNKPNK